MSYERKERGLAAETHRGERAMSRQRRESECHGHKPGSPRTAGHHEKLEEAGAGLPWSLQREHGPEASRTGEKTFPLC